MDTAAFLSGLAAATSSKNLSKAAWALERASDEFSYASALIAQAIEGRGSATLVKELLTRASLHVLKGAKYEELASKYLLAASKELSTYSRTTPGTTTKSKVGTAGSINYVIYAAIAAVAASALTALVIKGKERRLT